MKGYVEAAESYFRSKVARKSLEELAREYDEMDVLAVLLAWDAETATGRPRVPNDLVAQACREFPKTFIGFGSVDPLKGERAVAECDRIAELGLKGVKLHPSLQAFAPNVSEINGYKTGAWTLKGAQILNVYYEVKNDPFPSLMPVTLHPVIPSYAMFNVTHYPESPVGPFSIADVRVGCRAGVRPRGFTLKSYVSTEAAAKELASRWGYPTSIADVYLRAFHDRVVGRVKSNGRNILEVEHKRLLLDIPAKGTQLDITVETRDRAHAQKILAAFEVEGYAPRRVAAGAAMR